MNIPHWLSVTARVAVCAAAAVAAFLTASCTGAGTGRGEASAGVGATDTAVVAPCDSIAEAGRLAAAMLESFRGWTLDSVECTGVADGAVRFTVSARAASRLAPRSMHVCADSAANGVVSFIILDGMEKGRSVTCRALCIPGAGTVVLCPAHGGEADAIDLILVSKTDHRLRAIDYDDGIRLDIPAATGRNAGHKRRYGDKRTPEGVFRIYAIHDASEWDYDFRDGKGPVKGCYGKYFIRFKEYYHIGIHGTHRPETVGSRATEACIRLRNDDLERIVPLISVSETLIAVTPAGEDIRVGRDEI
ncbi:MAG: L,D-transpeptidase [Tannerella sp.]|jgi:hypothetical protein|nr:L,D-transpeptidase [Tannerella sp.]